MFCFEHKQRVADLISRLATYFSWIDDCNYSITCIQRPYNGSNVSGLLQQVVFKCRFYYVDLRKGCCIRTVVS